jgi:hypothetical protein
MITNVKKSIYDVIDNKEVQALKKQDPNFSLGKLFSPHITKFVNYTPKLCISSNLDKMSRRLKLTPDSAILGLMDEFYEAGLNPVLAGGKVISYLNGEKFEDSQNDYDLFFTSEEDLSAFKRYCRKRAKADGLYKDHVIQEITSLSHVTEYLFTSKVIDEFNKPIVVKIQIVHKIASCVEEIIENFDIRCCAVAYFKGDIYWIKGALRDIRDKKATLLTPRNDIKVFLRILKYYKKGYEVAIPDLVALSVLTLDPIVVSHELLCYDPHAADMITNRDSIYDRTLGYEDRDHTEEPIEYEPVEETGFAARIATMARARDDF